MGCPANPLKRHMKKQSTPAASAGLTVITKNKYYELTDGDKAIFKMARDKNDPNIVLSYYLRNEYSGTYWRPVTQDDIDDLRMPQSREVATKLQDTYISLFQMWESLGKPEYFGPSQDDPEKWMYYDRKQYQAITDVLGRVYRLDWDSETNMPVFHHPHGRQMFDWQMQMHRDRHPLQVVIGAFACIAGETRIYDAGLDQHIPVQDLYQRGRAPTVLAWTGSEFVKQQASMPWIKGHTDLYRITLKSGKQIVVTKKHRLLTSEGWRDVGQLSVGDTLPATEHNLPLSNSAPCLSELHEGVQCYSRTIPSSQERCSTCCHQCDERLLRAQENSLTLESDLQMVRTDSNYGAAFVSPAMAMDTITKIEFERTDVFYDISVPGYENYLAEGVINHNSAKTMGKALSFLYRGITLPAYRAFALAPLSKQSEEVHKVMFQAIEGTYFERFLESAPMRPVATIRLANDYTGLNTIECYSLQDDPTKLRTMTADEAMVDQAEEIDDLAEVLRSVGTRFRGQTNRGRPRRGQISFIANAKDNPQLWDYFDEGVTSPKFVWAIAPTTFQNPYLTVRDLSNFEQFVGTSAGDQETHMLGHRPMGNGEHFSAATLTACRDGSMDIEMEHHLTLKTKGYVKLEQHRTHVHRWEMPPQKDRIYCVVADPGWGDPPDRNSCAIGVFDITDFPRIPARLRAFDWVFGGGSSNPWITKYTEYVTTYNGFAWNGYDATGPSGAGYEKIAGMKFLMSQPVLLNGQKKYAYLNLLKKEMADTLIRFPNINHLYSQLSKYRLPDEGTRQDIVSMLIIFAAITEPLFLMNLQADTVPEVLINDLDDRWARPYGGEDYERSER